MPNRMLISVFAAFSFLPAIPAAAQATRAELIALLNSDRVSSQAAIRQATEQYEPLSGDPWADHAYLLVLMEQRRYSDALKLVDRLLAADPANIAVRRNKAWLLALTRNFSAAIVELDTLSRRLAETPAEETGNREEREAVLRFLGQMHGFLAGPAGREISTSLRERYRRQIITRLDEAEREIFEASAGLVLETHGLWVEETEQLKAAAVEDAAAARENLLAAAEAQRESMARQREALEARRNAAEQDYRTLSATTGEEEAGLSRQAAEISARGDIVRRELLLLRDEMALLEAELLRTRDPLARDAILRRLDQLAVFATRYEADLFAVGRQLDALELQRYQLAARNTVQRNQLEAGLAQVARDSANLSIREQRLDAQMLRSTRPASGYTQRVRALEALSSALTSYEPFVFEEERIRLMQRWDRAAADAAAEVD